MVDTSHGVTFRNDKKIIGDEVEKAVTRVIQAMHRNLRERITVDDMARIAMFSKFHFCRIFQRVTGVSPGRFLSALRLQEAKRLLLTTSLSVTEITYQVGYTSISTFSMRFKGSVGLCPREYRRLGGFTQIIPTGDRGHSSGSRSATVKGDVQPPAEAVGLVFVGLFPDCISEGCPVCAVVLPCPGPYELDNVPPGTWRLRAHAAVPGKGDAADGRALVVGVEGPITIGSETSLERADLRLRPMRVLDPPVLLALLDPRRLGAARADGAGRPTRTGVRRPMAAEHFPNA